MFNTWGVWKWAYFQKNWSVPLNEWMNEVFIHSFIWTEKYLMHWQILWMNIYKYCFDLLIYYWEFLYIFLPLLKDYCDPLMPSCMIIYFMRWVFGDLFVGVYFDMLWISKVHGIKNKWVQLYFKLKLHLYNCKSAGIVYFVLFCERWLIQRA